MGISELHDHVFRMNAREVEVVRKEIYRYLGYRKIEKNEVIDEMVDKAIELAIENMSPACICETFPVTISKGCTNLGFASTDSSDIVKNLRDSERIILIAATLGPRFDQLMLRFSRTNPTMEAILQATGAMFIESFLDYYNEELRKEALAEGYALRPRYSPGYGDLPLSLQKNIFSSMRMDRIGLTLTDSYLMVPSKSVTAIIGMEKL